MLKNLLTKLNKVYPFNDFLYILQLEEYESLRYLNTIKRLFFRRNLQIRDSLKYTSRVKITFFVALLPSLLLPPLTPIFIGLSNIILTPVFELSKSYLRFRAMKYFKLKNKNTKVIVIAGSFGKTTTKNYIYELIRYNYITQMIPGNINTPTGIAEWIIRHYDNNTQVLLVEVDTYFVGEIKRSLKITPPDISILTNIGDQHLERLGSKKNLKKALMEVFTYSRPNSIKIKNKRDSLEYALEVAKILEIPKDIVNDTIKKLRPPERRGNIIKVGNHEVIDNSYNISEATAIKNILEANKIAKRKNKKLITIIAGIPELGIENKDANIHLGKMLENKAQKIILLQSILSGDVEKGITNKSLIIKSNSMKEALEEIKKFDPKKYIVLMQPELNDLYY